MKSLFTFLMGLVFVAYTNAQSLQPATLSTNSTVEVIEQDGDITYLGGSFTQLGFKTNYHSLIPIGSNIPGLDLLQPNTTVEVAIPDGSGGWYIGGSFTNINGESVTRLAHILPDQTIDPNFSISLNSTVSTLELDNNDLYVGGVFSQASGIDVSRLIRVNAATGALDNSWLPQITNGTVKDIVINGDNVYAAGSFSNVEGEDDQRHFAIFSKTTGETLPSYSFNSTVEELYLEEDKLFAAGSFTQIGVYQSYLSSFNPSDSDFPLFDFPDANSTVEVIIPDEEGGWYIGGSFTLIDGESYSRLIHVLGDGTVDSDFTPVFNSTVESLFIDGNDLYVGGSFTQVNGFNIQRIARLDKIDGTLDETWTPNPNSTVQAVAANGNNVYVGGSFTEIAGNDNAIYFAVIDAITAESVQSHSVNSTVLDIELNGSDVYLGGSFNQSGFRNRFISKFSPSDDTPVADFPDANGGIFTSIPDGNGGWYIGGNFSQIEGESAQRIAHILSDNTLDPDFNCVSNSTIHDIYLDGQDLYIVGSFTTINGVSQTRAARVNSETGALDETWNPSFNTTVLSISVDDSHVYVGGNFTTVNGSTLTRYFAVLDKNTAALIQAPSANNAVYDFEENGENLFAAGAFTATGYYQTYLASFPDGSTVPEFNSEFTNSSVYELIPDGNGGYYAAGAFTQVNGVNQQRIVHFLSNGTVDDNFNITVNGTVLDMLLDGNDLYFCGTFTNVNGSPITRLSKVNANTGVLDTDFAPSINSTVNSLSKDGNTIYFGGSFNQIDGETRERLAAVDTDGSLIASFSPSVNSTIEEVEVISGDIYFGGSFSQVNGTNSRRIASVDNMGVLTSFDAGEVNGTVYALINDGSDLYIGGSFTQINGTSRNRLASLNLSTGALQGFALSVDNGAVFDLDIQGNTLALGGSFTQASGEERRHLAEINLTSEELGERNFSTNSSVRSLLYQGTNLLVGGDFTYVNTQSKSRIFELNTDLLIPTDFLVENIAGNVNGIDLEGSTLYLGGTFGQINGENRLRVAALDLGDLSLLPLNPEPNSTVNDLEVVGDLLYLGGSFTQIGGEVRNYTGAYNMNTSALTDWNPSANSTVNDITIAGTDIILGGNFSFIGFASTTYLAELDPTTNEISQTVSQGVNSTVYDIFIEDNHLYAGGTFSSFGGENRNRFALYNLDTESVEPLTLNCNNRVEAIFKDGDNLYIGGLFNTVNDVPKGAAACYDLQADLLTDWNPRLNSWCYAIGGMDGNVILGGPFSQTDVFNRSKVACVDLMDGTPNPFQVPNINGTIFGIDRYGEDLILGGTFNSVASESRPGLAAVNAETGELTELALTDINNWIDDIKVVGDDLYLAGRFTTINSTERGRAAAINLLTEDLTEFNPQFNSNSYFVNTDGTNLFYGGIFTITGLHLRNRFAAINSATNEILELGSGAGFNSTVYAIEYDDDNVYIGGVFGLAYGENRLRFASIAKASNSLNPLTLSFNNTVDELKLNNGILYCGGSFTDVAGNSRMRLASIDLSSGTLTDFAPELNSSVADIEFNDGNIYFSGSFSEVDGQSRGRLAAIDLSDNSLLDFDPGSNSTIRDFDFSDGLIYAGGDFSVIGGESRGRLASISPVDGSATAWNPGLNGSAYSLDIIENYIFVGGSFTGIGGEGASRLTLLDKNTSDVLFDFTPALNSTVRAVHYFGEQVLVGGQYTIIGANYAHPYFSQFNIPPPGTSTFTVELTSLTDVNGFDIGCNGDNTGEVEISVSGGVASYSYTLTNENQAVTRTGDIANSSETATESDLPAGNYTISVSDGDGGVANGSILLTEPDNPFEADLTVSTPIQTQGGSEGAIEIDIDGGNPPYTYSYTQDAGEPVTGDIPNDTENEIIEGLSAGSYVFNFEDANGCTTSEGITLDDYVPVDVSFTIWDEIICNGDDNGRIRIQATNGIPPYNYELDGPGDEFDVSGTLNFNGSSVIINDLGPGVYSISITDQSGAEYSAEDLELIEPNLLSVVVSVGSPVSTPGNNDGSIDVSVSGGVPGFSYTVFRNEAFNTSGFSSISDFSVQNLIEGEYEVLVTDQNSCQVTSNSVVLEDGTDPCAGLGGDSDGDGICDDNDPCPLLPDLENDDSCGINGTVVNCECVEECNLTLGTPVVECVTNTDEVDNYTVTISYSGSAPGAVLSVMDITGCGNENIAISGDDPSTDTDGSIVLTVSEEESCWGLSITSDLCDIELNGTSPECDGGNFEGDALSCSDGIDNDGDGLIDCEDGDCQGLTGSNPCLTCFDDGLSFADEVIEYSNPCSGTVTNNPEEALGVPNLGSTGNEEYVSLGGGGFIKLGFTNNTLVNSGTDDPDLFIFEIGPAVEGSFIELRPLNQSTEDLVIAEGIVDSDGDGFYEFGSVGGSTADVDIDSFFENAPGSSLLFDAIKITDDGSGCGGTTPGADIDGVCALSSLPCSIGAPCDDGDPNTENDVFQPNCECEGEPIFECPDLMANNGDDCEDGGTVENCICKFPDCNGDLGGTVQDSDSDGICDDVDNCISDANPGQEDLDEDGQGDVCDSDIDGDGVPNGEDCAPFDPNQSAELTWYADGDGDGYGTDETTTACEQPDGFAPLPGDCDDNNPDINPGAQFFSFTGTGNYESSVVFPEAGSPSTEYTFQVIYTDASGGLPPFGFPRVLLDYEGNGILTNPNDRTILLTEDDASDNNTVDGKLYSGSIIALASGTDYELSVQSIAEGCVTTFGPFDAPDVLNEPDLEIFADNIIFDNFNPEISSPLEVKALITNASDLPAENFTVDLVNQFDPDIDYPEILVPYIAPNSSDTLVWNITTPDEPAWCPIQITVDSQNVIAESNEDDNVAVRPFVNGDFEVPGDIIVDAGVSPSVQFADGAINVNIFGFGEYIDTAIPLDDPSVAGGTVTITNPLTGATTIGNTNSNGYFSVPVSLGDLPPGTYTLDGELTDFTLTGEFSITFQVIEPIVECLPDLRSTVSLAPGQIFPGETISGSITVWNAGCAPTEVTTFTNVTQTGGTPSISAFDVPPLEPGEEFVVTFENIIFNDLGVYTICSYADANFEVAESSEGNNNDCESVIVVPPLPDIATSGGSIATQFQCFSPTINNVSATNIGYVPTGEFDYEIEVFYEGELQTTLTGLVDNLNPNEAVSIPIGFAMENLGVYTYSAKFDLPLPNGEVEEISEANNVGNYTREIVECMPDLRIASCGNLEVDPADLQVPGEATYIAKISNNGNGVATGPIPYEFSVTNGDTYTGSYPDDLAPGQTVEVSVTASAVESGTEELTATADPENIIEEFSENNNSQTDVLCWDFEAVPKCGTNFWNATYAPNQTVLLSVGLKSNFLYKASEVPIKFEVSGPGITGTVDLGNAVVENVKKTCGCPYVAVLPTTFLFTEVGTYTFTMTADPDGEYSECDEDNNVLVREVEVTTFPDLRILSEFINPSLLNPEVGESVFFDISYENLGVSNTDDELDLTILVDEEPFQTVENVSGLLQGENATISLAMPYSSTIAGAHIIRAVIDSQDEVQETNELNNEATRAIIVGSAANLFFEVFLPDDFSPEIGQSVDIDATIGNNGDLDVDADVLISYVNNNGNEVLIGTVPISVEAGGSVDITLPWNVSDNNTTLLGEIANASEVEFDYTDNFASAEIGSFDLTFETVPFCEGSNPGSATVIASGGEEPYSYNWSTGSLDQTIEGAPGTYSVTVIDANGAEANGTASIGLDPTCVEPECSISAVSFNVADQCDPETGLYNVSLTLAYSNEPETGTIDVNGQSFDITGSPQMFNFDIAEGAVLFNASFSDSEDCSAMIMTGITLDPCESDCEGIFGGDALPGTPCVIGGESGVYNNDCQCITLPSCSLVISSVDVTDACDPETGLYGITATIEYSNEPNEGTLNVNGQSFDITGSPQAINLTQASGDIVIEASFSAADECFAINETGIVLEPCLEDCNGVFGGDALPGTTCMNETGQTGTWTPDCNCAVPDQPIASLFTLECGGQVIQITGAVEGSNGGGSAISETRTIYAFAPDGGNGLPTYEGEAWPYVILDGDIIVQDGISAELTTNEDGVLLVNGWPAYQFSGDQGSSDTNGTFGPWSYFLESGELSQDACPVEPCSVEILDIILFTDPCVDPQPIVDLAVDINNPNGETSATIFIDYSFNMDFDDEEIEIEIPAEGGEVAIPLTLEMFGVTADISISIGDGETGCEASVSEAGYPIPTCVDCEDLGLNIGDTCTIGGVDGTVSEDCECIPDIPTDCEDYEYFLADILEDGTTNIYEVSLSGTEAALSWVATSEYEVHIALNESDGMIYAVSKLDGSFRMLNPETGTFGPVEMLDTEVSEIIGATFNADGKMLISSQSENKIYSVMLGTNEVSVFDSYSPILGGDIDFGSDGALYLATREGFGTFYLAIPDEVASDILIGDAPQLVTGVADTESGQLIFSHRDATTLMVREYDGTPGTPYDITLEGESFMTFNGDLASGCADNRQDLEECEQVIYYTNQPPGSGDYTLYSTVLNGDGTATNTELLAGLGSSHIGVSPDGAIVYIVGGSDLHAYDTELGLISSTVPLTNEAGAGICGFPACVVTDDGTLYIAGNGDNIYSVDPGTGVATLVTGAYDVNGGDLVESPDGELWIITRGNNTFTRISDGLSFVVAVPEINGAAFLENGNVLLSNGDGDGDDALIEVNISTLEVEGTYDNDFPSNNGDLAATCVDPDPDTSNPCLAEGVCNAASAVYVEGTTQNGGSISPMRSNPDNALGAPEGTDAMVFTSLGYGGSLTFEFDGVVPNAEGDDIQVVETSFGNPGCEAYPEYADVSVSADGEDFYYIGTICKSDNSVDISDAEVSLDCVSYVRVANNDGLTSTPDGFDVDGIIAIHNCDSDEDGEGGEEAAMVADESNNMLSSYPNPTNGISQAVFITGQTERATLEVYDMNGRLVEGLFSGMAESGVEYRVDFDGLRLPNGVYMYRLTTESETIVEKFMIAK